LKRYEEILDKINNALLSGRFDDDPDQNQIPKQKNSSEIYSIFVKKKGKWMIIPSNLLIKGDKVR
jgi:hypothetical protein